MTLGKRIYWVLALVVVMALAGAAVTMASSMTSAGGSGETLANQTCDCDQQDEADDTIENGKGTETDADEIQEECECGSQDEADDAIEGAAKNGPDLDNIEGQFGDQNGADDWAE